MIKLLDSSYISQIVQFENDIFEHSWSESQIVSHLCSGNPIWGDLSDSNTIRGLLIVSHIAPEWEIYRISVNPQFRRQGIAKGLIAALESKCGLNDSIFLEVRSSNIAALDLYRAAGFISCGIRKKYYSDGENAELMMKSF